ncbi:MAG TPA: thioredoxin family protein [Dehalococcoidia bacterium]|nr:thioredoxin family protein [Dehalococcoidia bacterium]
MPRLLVYTARDCRLCTYARALAAVMGSRFPTVEVDVIDIDDPAVQVPAHVFAVPTFVLDGRVVSVGNPAPEEIQRALAEAVRHADRDC